MADRVILVDASTADLMRSQVPEQMIHDLLTIAAIPTAQLEAASSALDLADGFLSDERLAKLVEQHVPDGKHAAAVVSALKNVPPRSLSYVLKTLDSWRSASAENASRMSQDDLATIGANLQKLVRDYDSIKRSRKARRLRSTTGNIVQEVELLCDIRPVYDDSRTQVDGLIPLIVLKIVFEKQNNDTGSFEATMQPNLLAELIDKTTKANQKLEALRECITNWIPGGLAEDCIDE